MSTSPTFPAGELYARFAGYDRWMNEKLYDAAAGLAEEERS